MEFLFVAGKPDGGDNEEIGYLTGVDPYQWRDLVLPRLQSGEFADVEAQGQDVDVEILGTLARAEFPCAQCGAVVKPGELNWSVSTDLAESDCCTPGCAMLAAETAQGGIQ